MNRFRQTREHLGLSQAEMATKLGVHQTTISRFETGVLPIDERTALALDALTAQAAASNPRKRPAEPTQAAA